MSIIQERIRNVGADINLKISFSSNDSFTGYQQEIDNLTQVTSLDLVNPVVNGEMRKFKMLPTVLLTQYQYYFNNFNTFLSAGFTTDDIANNTVAVQNSFFILDYYDSFDPYTQNKIFTTYLTKILTGVNKTPVYNVSAATGNQFYYWYVPVWYMEAQTGTTATGYIKLSFYNAKTGKIQLFYNNYNIANPIGRTPEKMYFKAQLDIVNRTWKFLNVTNGQVVAKELTTSIAYNDRVDNTYGTVDNIAQTYPSGTTYNYTTNKYS
jgi:hypothetical protein